MSSAHNKTWRDKYIGFSAGSSPDGEPNRTHVDRTTTDAWSMAPSGDLFAPLHHTAGALGVSFYFNDMNAAEAAPIQSSMVQALARFRIIPSAMAFTAPAQRSHHGITGFSAITIKIPLKDQALANEALRMIHTALMAPSLLPTPMDRVDTAPGARPAAPPVPH